MRAPSDFPFPPIARYGSKLDFISLLNRGGKHLSDETFHNFKALKSLDLRFWTTGNLSIRHWNCEIFCRAGLKSKERLSWFGRVSFFCVMIARWKCSRSLLRGKTREKSADYRLSDRKADCLWVLVNLGGGTKKALIKNKKDCVLSTNQERKNAFFERWTARPPSEQSCFCMSSSSN